MAISEPYELDGVSISGTEISIISGTSSLQNATTAGVYYPCLDPIGAALAKGDSFSFRVYEKVLSGSTKRVAYRATISHANSENLFFPGMMLKNGFDFTLQKDAGTDRNWDASVRAITGTQITEYDTLSAVSVGSSAVSIISGNTTPQSVTDDGIYQLWVDPVAAAMAKGDEFEIAILEKVEGTGGTQRVVHSQRLTDVQDKLWFSPPLPLINGWDMTIKKIAGTDRSFDASIRRAS
jgi:hypothetical protein